LLSKMFLIFNQKHCLHFVFSRYIPHDAFRTYITTRIIASVCFVNCLYKLCNHVSTQTSTITINGLRIGKSAAERRTYTGLAGDRSSRERIAFPKGKRYVRAARVPNADVVDGPDDNYFSSSTIKRREKPERENPTRVYRLFVCHHGRRTAYGPHDVTDRTGSETKQPVFRS